MLSRSNRVNRRYFDLVKAVELFNQTHISDAIGKDNSTVCKWLKKGKNIHVQIEYKIVGWYEDMT